MNFRGQILFCSLSPPRRPRWTNFFISDALGVIDPRNKFGHESLSEVRKMLGCLKCNYENCIFIWERLNRWFLIGKIIVLISNYGYLDGNCKVSPTESVNPGCWLADMNGGLWFVDMKGGLWLVDINPGPWLAESSLDTDIVSRSWRFLQRYHIEKRLSKNLWIWVGGGGYGWIFFHGKRGGKVAGPGHSQTVVLLNS